MKQQLKAEAYVRSQRPALRKLTRGCVFTSKYNRNLKIEFTNKSTTTGRMNPGKHWNGILLNENGKGQKCKFPVDTGEIIGHQPQLQDWLAVLGKIGVTVESYVLENGVMEVEVNYEAKIYFNLTTGQPNSPEDYQAFNDIVGV